MNRIATAFASMTIGLLPFAALAADQHVVVSADGLTWAPAPAAFPKGAEMAVLLGDPGKAGPYVFRIRAPAGYKVPAHTHPADENVTVISGTFHIGLGAKLDQGKGMALKAGGFAEASKGMQHYAWFSEPTVIQIHGIGPTGIDYVDPNDDPRRGN